MESWWLTGPRAELSQGDIIKDVPFWTVRNPTAFLEKRTLKEIGTAWLERTEPKVDGHGDVYVLTRARNSYGLILSHDCELDKPKSRRRVHLAMLIDVMSLNPEEREKAVNSQVHARLVLPSIPAVEKMMYADLHTIVTVDRSLVDSCEKIASLSGVGLERLQAQLVAFFTRLEPPE